MRYMFIRMQFLLFAKILHYLIHLPPVLVANKNGKTKANILRNIKNNPVTEQR